MRGVIFLVTAVAMSLLSTGVNASRLVTLNNACVQIGVDFPLHVGVSFGKHLTTETCNGDNLLQHWTSRAIGDDISINASVESNGADLCIDVPEAKPAESKKVQVYGCNQTPAQRWRVLIDLEAGTLRFASALTVDNRWCLSVRDASGFKGILVLRPCSNSDSFQKFYLR